MKVIKLTRETVHYVDPWGEPIVWDVWAGFPFFEGKFTYNQNIKCSCGEHVFHLARTRVEVPREDPAAPPEFTNQYALTCSACFEHPRDTVILGEFDPRAATLTLHDLPAVAKTRLDFRAAAGPGMDCYVPAGVQVDILEWIDRAWQPVDLSPPPAAAPPAAPKSCRKRWKLTGPKFSGVE